MLQNTSHDAPICSHPQGKARTRRPNLTLLLLALVPLALAPLLSGCRNKVQSDLKADEIRIELGGNKGTIKGRVTNTGNRTYGAVFVALDLYEGEQYFKQIQTSADLFAGRSLAPGQTVSFSKDFEDGGYKPNRWEIVRLYATK